MDNIEAGRKLDALIAMKVMGYDVEPVGGDYRYYNDALAGERGGKWTSPVPAFSTDIKAALTVLERMYSHFYLSCRIAYISSSQIGVAFYTAAGAQDIFTEKMNVRASDISDSLATAISRAAYKTYEALNRVAGKAEVMPNPPES